MQICMTVVPNKFLKKCLSIFSVKWVYHKLYIFQFRFLVQIDPAYCKVYTVNISSEWWMKSCRLRHSFSEDNPFHTASCRHFFSSKFYFANGNPFQIVHSQKFSLICLTTITRIYRYYFQYTIPSDCVLFILNIFSLS